MVGTLAIAARDIIIIIISSSSSNSSSSRSLLHVIVRLRLSRKILPWRNACCWFYALIPYYYILLSIVRNKYK